VASRGHKARQGHLLMGAMRQPPADGLSKRGPQRASPPLASLWARKASAPPFETEKKKCQQFVN
jgi:hypothetical protein